MVLLEGGHFAGGGHFPYGGRLIPECVRVCVQVMGSFPAGKHFTAHMCPTTCHAHIRDACGVCGGNGKSCTSAPTKPAATGLPRGYEKCRGCVFYHLRFPLGSITVKSFCVVAAYERSNDTRHDNHTPGPPCPDADVTGMGCANVVAALRNMGHPEVCQGRGAHSSQT